MKEKNFNILNLKPKIAIAKVNKELVEALPILRSAGGMACPTLRPNVAKALIEKLNK